jgi:dGTPase
MRVRESATRIVNDLFSAFMANPGAMGDKYSHAGFDDLSPALRMQRVSDYLSGMTDTYAIAAHRRLFDHTPELR